jgi:hypothetical protein
MLQRNTRASCPQMLLPCLQAGLAAKAAAEVHRLAQDLLRGLVSQVHVPLRLVHCAQGGGQGAQMGVGLKLDVGLQDVMIPGQQRLTLQCGPHSAAGECAAAAYDTRRATLDACRVAPLPPLLFAGCDVETRGACAPQNPCATSADKGGRRSKPTTQRWPRRRAALGPVMIQPNAGLLGAHLVPLLLPPWSQ